MVILNRELDEELVLQVVVVYLGDEFLLLRVDLEVYLLLVVDGNAFVLLCLFHVNEFGLLKLPRHGYLIPG